MSQDERAPLLEQQPITSEEAVVDADADKPGEWTKGEKIRYSLLAVFALVVTGLLIKAFTDSGDSKVPLELSSCLATC